MAAQNVEEQKNIEGSVKEFIVENFLFGKEPENGIEPQASLMETGIIDSTGILEIIDFLEKTYAIKVEDDELIPENLDSLENIGRFISGKLNASADQ